MIKRILFSAFFLLFMLNTLVMSDEQNLPSELLEEIEVKTLRPFFNALKSGNVQLIKRYFSEEMYSEYRVLLEENKGYPDLLRKHYNDAVFTVERGVSSDNRVIVDFAIQFPGKGKQVSQYILQEQVVEHESENQGQTVGEKRWEIRGQQINQAR